MFQNSNYSKIVKNIMYYFLLIVIPSTVFIQIMMEHDRRLFNGIIKYLNNNYDAKNILQINLYQIYMGIFLIVFAGFYHFVIMFEFLNLIEIIFPDISDHILIWPPYAVETVIDFIVCIYYVYFGLSGYIKVKKANIY